VTALREWLNSLYVNLTAASRFYDYQKIQRLKKVTDEGAKFEDFADLDMNDSKGSTRS
jgi:hypothetical protein